MMASIRNHTRWHGGRGRQGYQKKDGIEKALGRSDDGMAEEDLQCSPNTFSASTELTTWFLFLKKPLFLDPTT